MRARGRSASAALEVAALPVFAVGRRTAEAARAAGFADVMSADGDVGDLARAHRARVAASVRRCSISRARTAPAISRASCGGRHQVADRRGLPRRRGRRVSARRSGRAAAGRIDGVLHFSRRSAEIYLDCARSGRHPRQRRSRLRIIACRRRSPSRCAAAGAAGIRVAEAPEEDGLARSWSTARTEFGGLRPRLRFARMASIGANRRRACNDQCQRAFRAAEGRRAAGIAGTTRAAASADHRADRHRGRAMRRPPRRRRRRPRPGRCATPIAAVRPDPPPPAAGRARRRRARRTASEPPRASARRRSAAVGDRVAAA